MVKINSNDENDEKNSNKNEAIAAKMTIKVRRVARMKKNAITK